MCHRRTVCRGGPRPPHNALLVVGGVLALGVVWMLGVDGALATRLNRVHVGAVAALAVAWLGAGGLVRRRSAGRRPAASRHHVGRRPSRRFYAIIVVIFLAYAAFNVYLRRQVWTRFYSTEGYITDFTIPEAWEVANRPITTPLFYKLLDNRFEVIELFQYSASVLGWSTLAVALLVVMRTRWFKLGAVVVVLLFSVSREVYWWNSQLLSEPLSHALLMWLLGVGILIFQRYRRRLPAWPWQGALAVPFSGGLGLWSMTRDANSYALLLLGVVMIGLVGWIGWRRRRWFAFGVLVALACGIIFAVQYRHAERGKRWEMPLINVMGDRILTDPDRTAFFVQRGMPINERVWMYAGHRGWDFHPDHDLRMEIGDWLATDGRRVYAQYLLSRPLETALAPLVHWEPLLAYHYSLAFLNYRETNADVPLWERLVTCAIWPDDVLTCRIYRNGAHESVRFAWAFPLVMMGGVLLVVILVTCRYGWDGRLWIPVFMLLLAYVLGFVAWHGDADSMERHAVQVTYLWRLAWWLALGFALDWMRARHSAMLSIRNSHAAPSGEFVGGDCERETDIYSPRARYN